MREQNPQRETQDHSSHSLSNKLNIRHFMPSDLEHILELEKASFTVDAFSEGAFRRWHRKCPDLFIVAEVTQGTDNKHEVSRTNEMEKETKFEVQGENIDNLWAARTAIAGYMITCVLPDKGDIVSIAIAPAYRRQEIGRALVTFTFDHLRGSGLDKVELEVRPTNEAGVRFWENIGFFPIETIPNFYRDGAEALRMRKWLL